MERHRDVFGTPVIAAIPKSFGGPLQASRWGATWRASVTAEQRHAAFDQVRLTSDSELGAAKEVGTLNDLVPEQDRGFFGRVLGRSRVPDAGAAGAKATDRWRATRGVPRTENNARLSSRNPAKLSDN